MKRIFLILGLVLYGLYVAWLVLTKYYGFDYVGQFGPLVPEGKEWLNTNVKMDGLTLFGLFAVSAMLVFYALEQKSRWFIFLFALSCWMGSAYGFLQGAWPFGLVECIWGFVAVRKWWMTPKTKPAPIHTP